MKNLRIVTGHGKSVDVYHTGDYSSPEVFHIVRDFELSDCWDKSLSRGKDLSKYYGGNVLEKGITLETVYHLEHAQFILEGLKKKYGQKKSAKK